MKWSDNTVNEQNSFSLQVMFKLEYLEEHA